MLMIEERLQSIMPLPTEILAPSGEEMLSRAIALTLLAPVQNRAELFQSLTQQIADITSAANSGMKPWACSVYNGTDGSRIFRGGIGLCIVIDPEGRLWRARTYEDFETTYAINGSSCEIATIKPNYQLMREYVIR